MIGMPPAVWGPLFWNTMHVVSLGYTNNPSQDEQTAVIQFYKSLEFVIPCPICRAHYSKFLKEMPVENNVTNRDTLVKWLFDLHNKVNKQLNKSVITWEQYIAHIKNLSDMSALTLHDNSAANTTNLVIAAIAGVFVGVAGMYTYNHYVKK